MVRNVEYQKAPFEERYEIIRELGSGHFAIVRQCVEKLTGNAYAAKFIRKRRQKFSRRGAAIEDIENEISIVFSLKHEYVIGLHEVYEDDNNVILVLELVTGGELFHYLSERDHLSEEDASKFVQQILTGLDHLHQHNIAHLDLKPENILLQSPESQVIKIIDFGLARRLEPGGKEVKCMMGTAEFVAPEIINYEALSLESDMWSVGVITYMLLSGSSPFAGQDQQETFANITRAEFDFDEDVFATTSDLAKDFIQRLLVRESRKRMSARQALEHPWIRPRNSQQIVKRKASAINMTRLKAFAAKRRWQKSLRVIKLCNRLSKGNRPASTASLLSTDASSNETLDMPENFVVRAIFCAIEDGNRQGLERLLSMAAVDLTAVSETGITAAHVAAGAGRLQILQFLHIDYRLPLDQSDYCGDTPLHWAARNGRKEIVRYLMDSDVDPGLLNNNQENAFLQSVRYGHTCVFPDFLAALTCDTVNLLNNDGEGCIHLAAWYGSTECLSALLKSVKINPNLQNAQKETALHICASKGTTASVEALLAVSADCNIVDQMGWIPLVTAVRCIQPEVVELLLPRSKLIVSDRDGLSVLHHAAEVGNLQLVDYIVEKHGETVNKPSDKGSSALHLAAKNGYLEIARLLCAGGADVELLDADGLSAEVIAMLNGHKLIGEFLRNLSNSAVRAKLQHEIRHRSGYLNRFCVRVLGHSRVGKTTLIKALQNSPVANFVRRGSEFFRRKSGRRTPTKSHSVSNINQMRHGYPLFSVSTVALDASLDVAIFEMSADPLCLQFYCHLLHYTGCLYVVVFNLADPASVQRQQVSFWLRLLSLSYNIEEPIGYCGKPVNMPVVVLVGTHGDAVKCNKDDNGALVHPTATTLLENMKRHFSYEVSLLPNVFVVDNHKNAGSLSALRNCVWSVGKLIRLRQDEMSGVLQKVIDHLPVWRNSKLMLDDQQWMSLLQNEINPLITVRDSRLLTHQLLFMGEIIKVKRHSDAAYIVISPHALFNQLVMPFLYGQLQLTKNQRFTFRPRDLHFIFSNYWHDTMEVTEALSALKMCSPVGVGDSTVVEFPAFVDRTAMLMQLHDPGLIVLMRIPDFPSYPLLVMPIILAHVKSSVRLGRHLMTVQLLHRGARVNDDIVLCWNGHDSIEIVASGDKNKAAPVLMDLCSAVGDAVHFLLPSALLEYTVIVDGQPMPSVQYEDLPVGKLPLTLICRLARLLDPKNSTGQDWCLLAVKLQLYEKLLERLVSINAIVPAQSPTHYILKEWTNHSLPKPTVQELLTALEKIERKDAAEILKQFLPVYRFLLREPFEVIPSSPYEKTLSSMSSSVLSR